MSESNVPSHNKAAIILGVGLLIGLTGTAFSLYQARVDRTTDEVVVRPTAIEDRSYALAPADAATTVVIFRGKSFKAESLEPVKVSGSRMRRIGMDDSSAVSVYVSNLEKHKDRLFVKLGEGQFLGLQPAN